MKELGITKGEWFADLRSGCCAIYLKSRKNETNGLHYYDDRNLFYSNKGALRDERGWIMDEETQANFLLTADAGNTAQKCGLLPSELLQQRDELREALINVMVVVRDCYPLLFDNEKPAVKQAEAAIKNTER